MADDVAKHLPGRHDQQDHGHLKFGDSRFAQIVRGHTKGDLKALEAKAQGLHGYVPPEGSDMAADVIRRMADLIHYADAHPSEKELLQTVRLQAAAGSPKAIAWLKERGLPVPTQSEPGGRKGNKAGTLSSWRTEPDPHAKRQQGIYDGYKAKIDAATTPEALRAIQAMLEDDQDLEDKQHRELRVTVAARLRRINKHLPGRHNQYTHANERFVTGLMRGAENRRDNRTIRQPAARKTTRRISPMQDNSPAVLNTKKQQRDYLATLKKGDDVTLINRERNQAGAYQYVSVNVEYRGHQGDDVFVRAWGTHTLKKVKFVRLLVPGTVVKAAIRQVGLAEWITIHHDLLAKKQEVDGDGDGWVLEGTPRKRPATPAEMEAGRKLRAARSRPHAADTGGGGGGKRSAENRYDQTVDKFEAAINAAKTPKDFKRVQGLIEIDEKINHDLGALDLKDLKALLQARRDGLPAPKPVARGNRAKRGVQAETHAPGRDLDEEKAAEEKQKAAAPKAEAKPQKPAEKAVEAANARKKAMDAAKAKKAAKKVPDAASQEVGRGRAAGKVQDRIKQFQEDEKKKFDLPGSMNRAGEYAARIKAAKDRKELDQIEREFHADPRLREVHRRALRADRDKRKAELPAKKAAPAPPGQQHQHQSFIDRVMAKDTKFDVYKNGVKQPGGPWHVTGGRRNGYIRVVNSQGVGIDVDKEQLKDYAPSKVPSKLGPKDAAAMGLDVKAPPPESGHHGSTFAMPTARDRAKGAKHAKEFMDEIFNQFDAKPKDPAKLKRIFSRQIDADPDIAPEVKSALKQYLDQQAPTHRGNASVLSSLRRKFGGKKHGKKVESLPSGELLPKGVDPIGNTLYTRNRSKTKQGPSVASVMRAIGGNKVPSGTPGKWALPKAPKHRKKVPGMQSDDWLPKGVTRGGREVYTRNRHQTGKGPGNPADMRSQTAGKTTARERGRMAAMGAAGQAQSRQTPLAQWEKELLAQTPHGKKTQAWQRFVKRDIDNAKSGQELKALRNQIINLRGQNRISQQEHDDLMVRISDKADVLRGGPAKPPAQAKTPTPVPKKPPGEARAKAKAALPNGLPADDATGKERNAHYKKIATRAYDPGEVMHAMIALDKDYQDGKFDDADDYFDAFDTMDARLDELNANDGTFVGDATDWESDVSLEAYEAQHAHWGADGKSGTLEDAPEAGLWNYIRANPGRFKVTTNGSAKEAGAISGEDEGNWWVDDKKTKERWMMKRSNLANDIHRENVANQVMRQAGFPGPRVKLATAPDNEDIGFAYMMVKHAADDIYGPGNRGKMAKPSEQTRWLGGFFGNYLGQIPDLKKGDDPDATTRAMVYDYLIDNWGDRHQMNVMFAHTDNGGLDLVIVDQGYAFGYDQPDPEPHKRFTDFLGDWRGNDWNAVEIAARVSGSREAVADAVRRQIDGFKKVDWDSIQTQYDVPDGSDTMRTHLRKWRAEYEWRLQYMEAHFDGIVDEISVRGGV